MIIDIPPFITSFGTNVAHNLERNKELFFRNYTTSAMQFHINRIFDLCFEDTGGFLDGLTIERVKIGYERVRISDEWGDRIDALDGTADFYGQNLSLEENGDKLDTLLSIIKESFPFDASCLDLIRAEWLDPINERWPNGFGPEDKSEIFRIGLGDELYAQYEVALLGGMADAIPLLRQPSAPL